MKLQHSASANFTPNSSNHICKFSHFKDWVHTASFNIFLTFKMSLHSLQNLETAIWILPFQQAGSFEE